MSEEHNNNPLHGKTLKIIMNELVAYYGWEKLASFIKINCLHFDPSINSCLKFLRKTPWAREKIERVYLSMLEEKES